MRTWIFPTLIALFFFVPQAPAQIGPISTRYQVPAEKDAHLSIGIARRHELEAHSIKTLVWNIKKSELEAWPKEFQRFTQQRDLILLQEAYRNSVFNSAVRAIPGVRWDMGISFLYNGKVPTGTMIGAKATPINVYVKHSPDVEPVLRTPKAITFAKYAIKGRPEELLVVSVHGINFKLNSAFNRQMLQAGMEIAMHPGPVIFAGDFNTWNQGRVDFLRDLVTRLGFRSVTFKDGHLRTKFGNFFLDHGFVRGLKVKNAEVVVESRGSDHKPMLFEVSL
jgi:endonuclease/exonuclease/phosphatase (EEP) superfamily protein YafD